MATQPTNLPVPSESPRDLKFNAGKIDEFVTSLVNTYIDRFGNEHYTIEGLRWLAQQAIAQYGWIPVGTFQAGATLTLPNQILKDTTDGEYYRWDGSFLPSGKIVPNGSTPSSTGGTGVGAWISVGDSALRSMLGRTDGESLVGGATYAQIRASNVTGNQIKCLGRSANRDGGEGWFFLDASDMTTADDDGTVLIDAAGRRWKRSYDGAKMAAWWGVKDGTDISTPLQNAVNNGGKIEVKDGQYNSTTPIVVDFTGANFPNPGRRSSRFDLVGQSQHNTTFNTNNIDFFTFTGNDYSDPAKIGQGIFSGMRFQDFCVYGTANTGRGLILNNAINVNARNLRIRRNRVAIALKGILVSDLYDCVIDYNETGLYMTTGLNSPMNANRFSSMKFGSNYRYAVLGDAGTRVTFDNCDFENNGWGANDAGGTDLTGNVSLNVVEPISTINFNDCYVEGNEGYADFEFNNATASPLIVNFRNCVFGRGNARGKGCKYVIMPRSTGGGPVILNFSGCFFYTQTSGGYVAKSSEPVIYAQSFLRVNGLDTCIFGTKDNMSNGIISSSGTIIVTVGSDGNIIKSPQWITSAKTNTGAYRVTSSYSLGVDINSFVVTAMGRTTGYRVDVVKISPTILDVRVRDGSGALIDGGFDLAIASGMWEGR
ncbi:hypothetical protein UXP06_14915 [Enterobacter ludwigii]|uniref:tail fiber/spike domain-containing protein n=1 Tax=Enterobacter ludwigii TaxID=299767 RepID=UPI002FD1B24C